MIFYPDTIGLHHLSSIALLGGTNVMKCRFCLEVACVGFRKNRHHRLKVIQPHTLCSYTSITFEAILCLFYCGTTQNFIFKYCILKTIWKKNGNYWVRQPAQWEKFLVHNGPHHPCAELHEALMPPEYACSNVMALVSQIKKNGAQYSEVCVSSLHRGHANLLCICMRSLPRVL